MCLICTTQQMGAAAARTELGLAIHPVDWTPDPSLALRAGMVIPPSMVAIGTDCVSTATQPPRPSTARLRMLRFCRLRQVITIIPATLWELHILPARNPLSGIDIRQFRPLESAQYPPFSGIYREDYLISSTINAPAGGREA